jgi:rifampicin phosphotransferase
MILFKKKLVDDHFIEEQLSHLDDPDKIINELDENYKKAKIEYDKLYSKFDIILRKKADLIQKFLYVRDYRFELYIRSTYNSIKIIEEVAKRLGLTYNEVIFMTPDELIKKEIPYDLHKRMEAFIFYKDKIYTGNEVYKWKELFNKKQNIDFVKGKGVSKGKIKGVAKIVLNADEAHKIEKGDIIICDITTPDYMHALHKVSAIVANIGGFTSHSAIVAREFNIPCVVGCGNATNIFKDNDLVEVDADNGIVRKIK